MQLERFPADAYLDSAYAEAESADYLQEEEGQRATAREVLDRIERHARGPGRLLDVGCWVGFLLAEARERGWQPHGVEPSRFASGYAREELGLDVHTGSVEAAALAPASFEAIFMGDVIEHLPEPAAMVERLRSLLAPRGVLALALPDAGSTLARVLGRRWWSVIPTHVQYFTRSSLELLLHRQGLSVLAVATQPKAFTVGYYVERVAGYSRGLSQALSRGAELAGVKDRLWAPDFRDRMLVIARDASEPA